MNAGYVRFIQVHAVGSDYVLSELLELGCRLRVLLVCYFLGVVAAALDFYIEAGAGRGVFSLSRPIRSIVLL